jgi:hypothetical protein
MFFLLKDAGYFDTYERISEKSIRTQLHGHAECIREWLLYSEDKRSDRGWYFQQQDGGGYIVAYFPSGSEQPRHYSNDAEACAFFIKRELEDIRQRSAGEGGSRRT